MTSQPWLEKAELYVRKLCLDIPNRRVGSKGNQAATDFFTDIVTSFGFETEAHTFDCMDWNQEGANLTVGGIPFEAFVSPYSLSCRVRAPLVVTSTVEQLEAAEISNQIILLKGEITKEQLMPKNFSFYNPEEHKHIIQLLEKKKPQAILAATSRNPELAGGMYPFPLIEDGDFDIPSVYMKDEEGDKLADHAGEEIYLESRATRIPSKGYNVGARKGGNPKRRVVLFAHIDAKIGTPGAIDNATGVVVLLLLAELLGDYSGELGIEIVAVNGEDYYSAPGEVLFLSLNAGKFEEILLGINLDGAGYYQGKTAYSLYDCTSDLEDRIRAAFSNYPDMIEGERWYQSDHSLFLMNQRPALTITSEDYMELSTEITHTPKDHPDIVEVNKLVNIAFALRDLLRRLDQLHA